jgi:tape measure domain-containing protein
MERLKWMFELFDRFSGPAKRMANSMRAFTAGVERSRQAAGRFGPGVRTLNVGLKQLAGGFAALKVAEWGSDLVTSSLGLVAFRESTLTSFEMMLGSAKEAQAFFKKGIDFARITPFEPQEVIKSFKQLLAAGFKKEEVPIAFQAIGDVVALSGMDTAEAFGRMSLAFSQISGKTKLYTQELNQIVEVSSLAGVGRAQIFESIAKNMKVTAKEVPAMMEKGLIDSGMAIYSILEAVKNRMGGELGSGMARQSKTLAGQWSTLKGLASEFFLTIDQKDLPGVEMLKDVMFRLTKLFDTNTAQGKQFQSVISSAFNFVADAVGGVMDAFETFTDMVSPAWDEFRKATNMAGRETFSLRDIIGAVAVSVGAVAVGVLKVGSAFWNFVNGAIAIRDWFFNLGKSVVDGFVGGIVSIKNKVTSAVSEMGWDAVNGMKALLGIRSPSRVFREMGVHSGEGFNLGLSKTLSVPSSLGQLGLSSPGLSRVGARTGGGQMNVQIQVDARGRDDADGIARRIREVVTTELASVFESVAIEAGVA